MKIEVTSTRIRIEIDAKLLKFATEQHPLLIDDDGNPICKVTNQKTWMKSVYSLLTKESEDGSTRVSRMLDEAIEHAIDCGEEGVNIKEKS